jgi:ribose transport system ATP-binding protein
MGEKIILKLENITKKFPGVTALNNVKLDIREGEIHALCGENGAGKSTLMKIIAGAQPYTSGKMYFEDKEVKFKNTKDAQLVGISMIYQEFNLVPELSIAENIFIGNLPMKSKFCVDWKSLNEKAKEIMTMVGLHKNPTKLVKEISVAESQMVEIAKCLSNNSKVIIMDEPTATLNDEEIECLFKIIEDLKRRKISIIYISHRMEEIFNITDRITVFRDGKYIKTLDTKKTDNKELVTLMVGKSINDFYPVRNYSRNEIMLQIKNLQYKKELKNIKFELGKGEILGIAGLLGSGNIQLSKVLFGAYETPYKGEIILEENVIQIKNPSIAIKNGIALVPDDRKFEGLVLGRSVKENTSLPSIDNIISKGMINLKQDKIVAEEMVKKLNTKVSTVEQLAGNLSGGNQQKIVLAKMLLTNPKILILAEPTRGIDVGAKAEIYDLMDKLTKEGISIILITSDLPELVGMSDRVLVMKSGEIVKELEKGNITQENILSYAAGGEKQHSISN